MDDTHATIRPVFTVYVTSEWMSVSVLMKSNIEPCKIERNNVVLAETRSRLKQEDTQCDRNAEIT
jgi:hypothetical protein